RILLGPLKVGEDHPLFALDDYSVSAEPAKIGATARLQSGSIRWVRGSDAFPFPMARLEINVPVAAERALLRWRGRAVLFQGEGSTSSTEVWVSLLETTEGRV